MAKSDEVVPEVAGERHRLQEDLRQHHRRSHVQVHAAPAQPRDLAREEPEVEVRRAAEGAGVAGRVHVDDVGADRDVHGRAQAEPPGRRQEARVQVARRGAARREVAADRGAEAQAVAVPLDDRAVHLLARLARHAEGPGAEARLDVLRGPPGHRDLEVVHDAGPVERDRGHEAALHEVDHHRREADLDDVGAEAPDHGAAAGAGAEDLVAQRAERLAGEDPREAVEEGGEARAPAVRAGEGGPRRPCSCGRPAGRSRRRRGRAAAPISGTPPPRRPGTGRGAPSRAPPGCAACRGAARR